MSNDSDNFTTLLFVPFFKMKTYNSISVSVENISFVIFILPL